MRGRWLGFIIAIILGIAAGLFIGWGLVPKPYANMAPPSLRADYQTDYVLMVAEIYQDDGNLDAARERLGLLGGDSYLRSVQQAIVNGQSLGYTGADIQALALLAQELQLPTFPTATVQP